LSAQHAGLQIAPPKRLLQQIRAYLIERQDDGHPGTNLHKLKYERSTDETLINLGPTIDKGLDDSHFHFSSGARLSFGLTVRDRNQHAEIVAYRFDYRLEDSVMRFDLNATPHPDPLVEPRAHFHPGCDEIRVPTPALMPIEILDLIFFVIDRT
jgi:hypothetical protein